MKRRWGEVDVPARTLGQPVADRLGLVGGVVVRDEMDVEVVWHVGLDLVEDHSRWPACRCRPSAATRRRRPSVGDAGSSGVDRAPCRSAAPTPSAHDGPDRSPRGGERGSKLSLNASCRIALSSARSATSFFSRTFSRSRSFIG